MAGVLGVLVALVCAIWVLPGWLDWNRYRDSIAAIMSDGLGRPVRIGGNVTLRLLPQPVLTAAGVSVDASEGGDGVALRADAAQLRVALVPLLGGTIVARELVLQGADLTLPWPPGTGTLAQRPPAWLSSLQARVERGTLHLGGVDLQGIEARLESDPDTGTLTVAGAGQVAPGLMAVPEAWRFSIRLARAGPDGVAPIEASIDGQDRLRDTGLAFSGQIAGDGALAGRIMGRGPNLSLLLPAPPLAWRADGQLTATAGQVEADALAIELDGVPARGTVAIRIGDRARMDMAITAGRLDLDAWAPVLRGPFGQGLPIGVELTAEQATLAGGLLRQVHGAFDFGPNGLTVRTLAARLPGDARLTLQGAMAENAFEATAAVTAPDFATTLRWAAHLMPAGTADLVLPEGILQTAELTGALHAGPDGVTLTGVTGQVDNAGVTGSVRLRLGTGIVPITVPALAVALRLDRLTLGPWLQARPPGPAMDVDLQIAAPVAQWHGTPVLNFGADARWVAGRLALRRLEGTVAGLRVQASGAAVGEPMRVQDGRIELETDDLAPAAPFLRSLLQPAGWDVPPDWLTGLLTGPFVATLTGSGPPDALQASIVAVAGDLRIEAQPHREPSGSWAGPVTLRHPGATRLLRAAGIEAAWLGEGSLSAVARGRAGPGGTIAIDGGELVAGAVRGRGSLAWDGAALTGSAAFETLALPSPALLDGWAVRRVQGWGADVSMTAEHVLVDQVPVLRDGAFRLSLQSGTLDVRGSAQWQGGPVSLAGTLDASSAPARWTGRAEATALRLTPGEPLFAGAEVLQSGVLAGSAAVTATGQSVAALLATLSGQVQATVQDGTAQGFDLPALKAAMAQGSPGAMRAAALEGQTAFDALELTIGLQGGAGSVAASLSAADGTVQLQGTVDIPAGLQDARLVMQAPAAPGGVEVRLLGPVGAPRRTPDLTNVSRWLAERP